MKPADGERRAIVGYYPQYRFVARKIYEGIRDGSLEWVRLVDPEAGRVDDCVIGYLNRVEACQVKWEREVGTISYGDLANSQAGKPPLIKQLYDGLFQVREQYPDKCVTVALIIELNHRLCR